MDKRNYMWFGARGYEEWVPAYARDADMSALGNKARSQTLDGGLVINGSNYAHREYNLDFESNLQEELEIILDHARGNYGPLLHFIDPAAAYRNVAPMDWAAPWMGAQDAPIPLIPDQRPKLVTTPVNTYHNPVRSAQYKTDRPSESLYVPIPEGHIAWVGYKGSTTGTTAMRLTPWHGNSPATGERFDLVPLPVTNSLLVNTPVAYEDATGFSLDLKPTGDNITLTALNIQVLRKGRTPVTGRFISGRGHTQLKLDGDAGEIMKSAIRQKMTLALKLSEVVV